MKLDTKNIVAHLHFAQEPLQPSLPRSLHSSSSTLSLFLSPSQPCCRCRIWPPPTASHPPILTALPLRTTCRTPNHPIVAPPAQTTYPLMENFLSHRASVSTDHASNDSLAHGMLTGYTPLEALQENLKTLRTQNEVGFRGLNPIRSL
ncbi:hypothetical protein BDW66DRAFT_38526 [Aspergillus desertorum]